MRNKYICSHPKNRISSYTEKSTNTYYERCLKCAKTLYTRKFIKEYYYIGIDLAKKENTNATKA